MDGRQAGTFMEGGQAGTLDGGQAGRHLYGWRAGRQAPSMDGGEAGQAGCTYTLPPGGAAGPFVKPPRLRRRVARATRQRLQGVLLYVGHHGVAATSKE